MAMPPQHARSALPSPFTLHGLRQMATWIRDRLDPIIAREGPNAMHPEDVLALHDLFQDLLKYPLDRDVMVASRIYLAIREVSGKATRWPHKLIDECDKIVAKWETLYGPLRKIRVPLYERGGRLFKVCTVDDLTKEDLLRRWTRQSRLLVDETRAYTHWQDEIEPGQWWINGMFAFRDGIIDSKSAEGGICTDGELAYAVVLSGDEEVEGSNAYKFTYRCRHNDLGRYRLTAACFKARYPLRVLRCHTSLSLWGPRVGIRYDGLYSVRGWSIKPVEEHDDTHMEYLITFVREPGQPSMDKVLLSPNAEDEDDFFEYRRLRCLKRRWAKQQATGQLPQAPTSVDTGSERAVVAARPYRGQEAHANNLTTVRPGANSQTILSPHDGAAVSPPRTASTSRGDLNLTVPRQLPTTPHLMPTYDGMTGDPPWADCHITEQETCLPSGFTATSGSSTTTSGDGSQREANRAFPTEFGISHPRNP